MSILENYVATAEDRARIRHQEGRYFLAYTRGLSLRGFLELAGVRVVEPHGDNLKFLFAGDLKLTKDRDSVTLTRQSWEEDWSAPGYRYKITLSKPEGTEKTQQGVTVEILCWRNLERDGMRWRINSYEGEMQGVTEVRVNDTWEIERLEFICTDGQKERMLQVDLGIGAIRYSESPALEKPLSKLR